MGCDANTFNALALDKSVLNSHIEAQSHKTFEVRGEARLRSSKKYSANKNSTPQIDYKFTSAQECVFEE
jgi:hypothetical protein